MLKNKKKRSLTLILRNYFITGVVVLIPIGFTLYLTKFIIGISSKIIPQKIDWVLRIDGHTDKIPINNNKFTSNWHLSSSRSINIVKFFINKIAYKLMNDDITVILNKFKKVLNGKNFVSK